MSMKAAAGAAIGGLVGATAAMLGKAFFTRTRNPEAFDAVTSAGVLVGATIGASFADMLGVEPAQASTAVTTTTPTA